MSRRALQGACARDAAGPKAIRSAAVWTVQRMVTPSLLGRFATGPGNGSLTFRRVAHPDFLQGLTCTRPLEPQGPHHCSDGSVCSTTATHTARWPPSAFDQRPRAGPLLVVNRCAVGEKGARL